MDNLLNDLRYGLRMLLKKPGFAAVAVLTLALGIGANTAIFSVVYGLLLRPLPFPHSDQLVMVFTKTSQIKRDGLAYPDLQDFREQSRLFSEMCGFVPQSVNLTGSEEPIRVRGGFVSADFFRMLKVEPAVGRGFLPGEDQPGVGRVVVVNHNLWQNRYGADPGLIGRSMILNGEVFTVAGIMPESFRFPLDEIEVWIPLPYYPNFSLDRKVSSAAVIGRLKPGASIDQAGAEMNSIASALAAQYPETNSDRSVSLLPFQELLVEDARPALLILLGSVGLVLLIACANVGNLLLARGVTREKEIVLRVALGASRNRIIRQLLTEGVLLSMAGGLLGLLLGSLGLDLLSAIGPADLVSTRTIHLDMPVLAFTLTLSVLTGLIFGLAPALKFSKPNLIESLNEGGRSSSQGSARSRIRSALVVAQVGMAMVLLIASGLLIKSLIGLLKVEPGFDARNVLTLEYRVPRNKYPKGEQQWNFHKQVVERTSALPGVKSAAVVRGLPFSGNGGSTNFVLLDRAEPPAGEEPRAQANLADTHFFDTLGIPLLRGRGFTDHDLADSAPVVVINRAMALRYWPDGDPLGKQVRINEIKTTAVIVGIVGDVKQYSLEDPVVPQIYAPYAQSPFIFATLVVRAETDPMSLANAVRGAVWSVDKDQPVWKVRTIQSLLDGSVGQRRFLMQLLGGFSVLALLLATIGIYSVITYSVSQRTREIGIRVALGADRGNIVKLVVGHGMVLASVGVAGGVGVALVLTRFLASLLFRVSPTDITTFGVVSLVLAAVALLACLIPARRATKVDPIIALRCE